jgi:hypothetical protein
MIRLENISKDEPVQLYHFYLKTDRCYCLFNGLKLLLKLDREGVNAKKG